MIYVKTKAKISHLIMNIQRSWFHSIKHQPTDLKLSCKTNWCVLILNCQSLTSTSCSIANMLSTHHHWYDLNFKLKIVAKAEAVNNNREIAHEYGISESMVWKWCNQQHVLFSGGLPMTAKCASLQHYKPKDLSWISCYRARALEHVCKFPLVCFSIEVDLSVLKAVLVFNL